VGTIAEIPEGEVRTFDLPTGRVGVAHDERRLFAFAETCTGEGCPLSDASFDDRSAQLTCVTCDSVFDLETGEPIAGPAKDPLPLYGAREDDGWLEVSELPVG
jgi:3-phenylpropionate/trans-cinnamate dioxygenase ferredoxin subunit